MSISWTNKEVKEASKYMKKQGNLSYEEMIENMKYKVILDSCGNIDIGENPFEQVEGAYRKMYIVGTIEECRECVREYIKENNLGSSQWNGGDVFTIDNKHLGYISYNGRFWEGETR